jgi:comEA protein
MVSRLFALVARRAALGVGVLALLVVSPSYVRAQAPAASVEKAAPVINLNTASAADLQNLPGVGARMAERIVEYRQKNGPFKKIEDLMNVKGIGEKNFLKLKARLSVGAPKASS